MNQYYPFIDIRESPFFTALGQLSGNVVTYWLSVPYFLLWSKFFDSRIKQRVRVAWEGHVHVLEVFV